MKAISPFIAIVLLIAFTVAVGGLISLFLTGLTTTQTGTAEAVTTNQTRCSGIYIDIYKVTSDKIFFSNPTTQALTKINFTTSDGTSLPANAPLAVGAASSYSWNRTASGTGNTSVTARGLCQDSIVVQGKCENYQYCWQ